MVLKRNATRFLGINLGALALIGASASVHAAPLPEGFCTPEVEARLTCTTGDGLDCAEALQAGDEAAFFHLLTVPTGYATQSEFETDAEALRHDTSPEQKGNFVWRTTWSSVHREKLLFFTYYVEGGPVGSEDAAFSGKIAPGVVRGKMLAMDTEAVDATVSDLQAACPGLDPIAVTGLFQVKGIGSGTNNAMPPGLTGRSYGIARISNTRVETSNHYIGPHELGHAAMNWMDEYREFEEELNVRELDQFTPLLILDQDLDE